MNNSCASAIVIGGGPAGSLAATLLARAGFRVDLFEQHVFPRDKVCGECLSGLGVDVLERAGLLESLKAFQPTTLTRSLLHPGDGPEIELALPRASMGISREVMDSVLLRGAVAAGVHVHQPARCERVDPSSLSLRWRNLLTNEMGEMSADWIVIADGKGALPTAAKKATGDLGIKTHFTGVAGPRDAVELFAGRGNYGGLAAVEADRWNAAFSVPGAMVRTHGGNLQSVFDEIVAGNSMLRNRLKKATRVGPWLAAPLPRFAVSRSCWSRMIPIGNAAAALEPVGGEGMGLALRSAELAVIAICRATQAGDLRLVNRLPREFNSLWKVRRLVCRSIAIMFSKPLITEAVAPFIRANDRIPSALAVLAGKAANSGK